MNLLIFEIFVGNWQKTSLQRKSEEQAICNMQSVTLKKHQQHLPQQYFHLQAATKKETAKSALFLAKLLRRKCSNKQCGQNKRSYCFISTTKMQDAASSRQCCSEVFTFSCRSSQQQISSVQLSWVQCEFASDGSCHKTGHAIFLYDAALLFAVRCLFS